MLKKTLIVLAILLCIGGVIVAQTATPEPEPTDCDQLDTLQAELAAQLEAFDTMLADDRDSALETLFTVGEAYQQLALDCGFIPGDIGERTVGTDVEFIMTALADLNGDPINGQLLYNSQEAGADGQILACSGCHVNSEEEGDTGLAPPTAGTWTRWDEIRRLDPALEAYTFAQYVTESIVLPTAYEVPDYSAAIMPNNFGERLTFQQLADLIAYLESQDQFLD